MANPATKLRKGQFTKPAPAWSDPIVRRLRTNPFVVTLYGWISRRLVPMVFALFVAAPIGALITPVFLPKFVRNCIRRRKYEVVLYSDHLERISGTYPSGKDGHVNFSPTR
jgi:hypothetical protein